MEADQPQNFNERLSQWIASQGFWFQLRYSMSSGGGLSTALFHLFRLALRALILLAIVALGFAFYLSKRVNSDDFKDGLSNRFAAAMSATDAEIKRFNRAQGEGKIRRIGAVGSNVSFFETLEAGTLNFKMSLLDGLHGDWDAGTIQGNWIDVHVKAGANSPEEAAEISETLFKRRSGFDVAGLNFYDAQVSWGFDRRMGKIQGSKMKANRVTEGWRFAFAEGTFSQNWIHGFKIEELVMLCTPSKLIVEKGTLLAGDGRVEFKDVEIEGGLLPEISGSLVLKGVPIEFVVPEKLSDRVSGKLSGELELSGSTNSTKGISMEGRIDLEKGDLVQIRSSFPLLEALDVVDVFNSYKRLVFEKGGFDLKTGGGEMLISALNLEYGDIMSLEGSLKARYPTEEEAAEKIGEDPESMTGPQIQQSEEEKKKDITLRRAAEEQRLEREENDGEESEDESQKTEFFQDLASRRESEEIQREARRRALNTLIFKGEFRMSIPDDAFERSRTLRERYPVDPATGRIVLDIPLKGSLGELTLRQAEQILRDGRSDDE